MCVCVSLCVCVHVLQLRGICMSLVMCHFCSDIYSHTCECMCVCTYSCWCVRTCTPNKLIQSVCASLALCVSVYASWGAWAGVQWLLYTCLCGAVCIPDSGCPHRSLYVDMCVFLCISILVYTHIWFCWYLFEYRSMLSSVICLSTSLWVDTLGPGYVFVHHVACQHGPCVYMLGPSWTTSGSCHVYLLGFNTRSALCWGFTVIPGWFRFRNHSAIRD